MRSNLCIVCVCGHLTAADDSVAPKEQEQLSLSELPEANNKPARCSPVVDASMSLPIHSLAHSFIRFNFIPMPDS